MNGLDESTGWRARALGQGAADLDIAFDGNRAGIVTALLAACVSDVQGTPVAADTAWDWTLHQRLQALIAVRRASGSSRLDIEAPCARCAQSMAITLDLDDFAAAPVSPQFDWLGPDGALLSLRLPTGRDLRQWQSRQGDDASGQGALAATLVEAIDGDAPAIDAEALAAWLPALDEAFEAHDPLTALHLSAACPACAHDNDIACDLEALVVDDLSRAQARLLDDVAQLAAAFHWSEPAIMALPAWRRARYLQRIAPEAGP